MIRIGTFLLRAITLIPLWVLFSFLSDKVLSGARITRGRYPSEGKMPLVSWSMYQFNKWNNIPDTQTRAFIYAMTAYMGFVMIMFHDWTFIFKLLSMGV